MDREDWQATVHGVAKESDMTEHMQVNLPLFKCLFWNLSYPETCVATWNIGFCSIVLGVMPIISLTSYSVANSREWMAFWYMDFKSSMTFVSDFAKIFLCVPVVCIQSTK